MNRELEPQAANVDPLDAELRDRLGPVPRRRWLSRWPRRHLALGLAAAPAPTLVFVPLGVLLGPAAAGLLDERVLGHLDAAVSVALAVLGVFVGLALGRQRPAWRLLAASSTQATVTGAVVLGVAVALLAGWRMPTDIAPWLAALCLALGASPSAAPPPQGDRGAATVADVDDLVPIAISAGLLAWLSPVGGGVAVLLPATIGIGAAVAVIGGLLLPDSRHPSERIVFVVGVLLLLGGAAAYLSLSPLLAGLVAGFWWSLMHEEVERGLVRDLQRVQHPLVALLLLVAGATSSLNLQVLWLLPAFVLARLTGKLLGSWLAARTAGGLLPQDLGVLLLSPGVLGVAAVLNVRQSLPSDTLGAVLAAVSFGAVIFEGLVHAMPPDAQSGGPGTERGAVLAPREGAEKRA